ncbi:MAG: SulP family inorganic anion transporter [Imperialibacter sp.]|uniref:SulP family inorganic anion transporter n=1 Tax=Imperialibacter sp. TaxID=2038411 RepID=UPI0030DC956B|tara:strand:- start:55348 stop:56919 length:1572 start_codon:yes stop_codon:yes gene_type:complete
MSDKNSLNSSPNIFGHFKYDGPAGLVVFLVALPLCLGIALASGAPLFSGVIAGIVGGLVVASFSGSQLAVSGPAAGLTIIVLNAIDDLGSFESFLLAVVIAGAIQLLLGFLKAGVIGNFFPSAVIKGMLAAIGLILILKQIPHAFGYDSDPEGDIEFFQPDGQNTFTEIFTALQNLSMGAIAICLISLAIILLWDRPGIKKKAFFSIVPAPLVVVLLGIGVNQLFIKFFPDMALGQSHLVSLPIIGNLSEFANELTFPDFGQLGNPEIYVVAITLAIIASLETLLSLEATDKLDPYKRVSPQNRELKAQGIGNMVSGLIGGLPLTAVIVRSSANIDSGAHTKMSAIIHGALLLLSVVVIPHILNLIPLAALAAILIMIGFKLAKPSLFRSMFQKGMGQFLPFVITIAAILLSDLLIGISIGMAIGLFFVIKSNFHEAIIVTEDHANYLVKLNKDVTFLNKSALRTTLQNIPKGAYVIIDGTKSIFIDNDISEVIEDFVETSENRNITVELKKSSTSYNHLFKK